MDPLAASFIFNTASAALSGIIVNMVNGQTTAVNKEELKREVTRIVTVEVKKHQLNRQEQELQAMIAEILTEIKILAARDKDIKLTNETIELKPLSGPSLPFLKDPKDARLERLHKIIAQRRQELRLPESNDIPDGWKPVDPNKYPHKQPEPPVPENPQQEINQNAEAWQQTPKEPEKSYWQKRIEDATRRIQIIRAGGEVIDEQDES
ncbi:MULTISPECIES: hypothetical protein [Planktothricoides]|uniref:Uncharacterized protein n=2 Tax=Planktothricoides raciborskii TaxID=132608 RepID=A0AAU8J8D7_9CYAN|nr:MULTISPECIES: hypothetical protein [Planktothricoides]MBD2545053.1 hypothetical protein [Planktothricoides raciborskii FACHB-1370]MBD2584809.1 hypothetical protein [Planktothricoides raciborskii FACHB-1261]